MERRAFLVAVGGATATAASARRVRGANDRLGVAVVGSGRRGRQVMQKMLETGRVELRALCAVLFLGTEGSLEIYREGYTHTPHTGTAHVVTATTDLEHEHVVDFLDAVREGRRPSADIAVGLEAVRPAHLAVAAHWSRKRMRFDDELAHIVEDV